MKVECSSDPGSAGYVISGYIGNLELYDIQKLIVERTIEKISDVVAERFLGDRLQEVLSLLQPEAIANLAVADAAGAIREALHKKLPDKVLEVVRTEREVYQRGVFGGMKRIR